MTRRHRTVATRENSTPGAGLRPRLQPQRTSPAAGQVQPRRIAWARRVEIARIVGRHGLGVAIGHTGAGRLVPFHQGALHHPRRDSPYERHEHLRMLFEDLGPAYIKLGQILSSRPDLLAERYRAELAHLQDAAPPDPTDVRSTVERELGRRIPEVFAAFDPCPVASASIGQAFAATLLDGTEVIVKVRRPGVTERIRLDLELLSVAARHLSWVWPAARRFGIAPLVAEFAAVLLAEIDYEIEAHNLERIRRNLRHVPGVRVPPLHRETSVGKVLTIDRAYGGRIDDPRAQELAGVDGRELASRLVNLMLHMVIVDGFFHADPHPGNILLAGDATIELIDFGMVGSITPGLRDHLANLMTAMVTRDVDAICGRFLGLGIAGPSAPHDGLHHDIEHLLGVYGDRPLGEIGLGTMLHDHLEVARRHGLRLPTELALLAKVLLMVEGLAARLDPDFEALGAFASIVGKLPAPQTGRVW